MKKPKNSKHLVIGVTGSFGSGKTTVARLFKKIYKANLLDADYIAHSLIKPEGQVYLKIVKIFGRDILDKNRNISRSKLARLVFNKRAWLFRLNRILHPEIVAVIKKGIRKAALKTVILDVPLLIEAGLRGLVDKLVVVNISRAEQVKRIKKKFNISNKEILKRLSCQMPLAKKVRLADFVIDNNGSLKETRRQVERIWKKLQLTPTRKIRKSFGASA